MFSVDRCWVSQGRGSSRCPVAQILILMQSINKKVLHFWKWFRSGWFSDILMLHKYKNEEYPCQDTRVGIYKEPKNFSRGGKGEMVRENPLRSFLSQSEMMCRFKLISLNLLRKIQNRLVLEKKLFTNYLLKQLLYSFIDRCFVGIDPNGI